MKPFRRLWRADYEKPMRRLDISKVRCSSAAFPKMFICRLRSAQPWLQKSCFSEVAYIQRSRNEGFSCYNVTPLPKNHCSISLFTTGYKRLTEGGP
jgi:hypothetical protein